MTFNEAKNVIMNTITELIDAEETVTEDMSLVRDLGISSMKLLTTLGELEDIFDVDLDMKKISKISTVGELCDFIVKQL